ncbi:biotin/lipoyl-containing protein [Cumulibacter manganitolerans]|uniref:biotin/lipoyl-containing protein n=1 Tax=Cumulibacter manganitolerans TaxID=1884992 RepID=UPI001294D9D7|nr:biotin/lipoyl-containing protein [Cumulibacter manganitolerans]
MSVSVTMPALGESVTEGTVTRWLKAEGDQVTADEPLLEVSTDKVDTEIPSPASGVLQKIMVQEDETVDVGAELAVIGDGAGDGGSGQEQAAQEPAEEAPAPAQEQPAEETPDQSAPADDSAQQASAEPAEQPAQGQGGGAASGTDVTMPALGESVTEGTVTRWLKQVGEEVQADEPLLEVSTDKVDTEIPAPASGTLLEIRVQEDETVDVGAVLAVIGQQGAQSAAPAAEQPAPKEEAPQAPAPAAAPAASIARNFQ